MGGAAESKQDLIAALDAQVFHWMARGREANIQVGRALTALKKVLRHGRWQRHIRETFAPRGLSLRTAARYMQLATQEDAVSKNAKMAVFKPATDRGAQQIRVASERAQEEVAAAGHKLTKAPRSVDGIYQLPLRMTGDEKNAVDALRQSPDWPFVEKRIIAFLKRLFVKHGINKSTRRS